MASQSGVPKQEIIPSSELPQFDKALAVMSDLEAQLAPLQQQAQNIKITDAVSFASAGAIVAQVKAAVKSGDATMYPYDAIIKRVKDYIQQRKQSVKLRGDSIRELLDGKMGEYTRAEEAAAKAERDLVARETEAKLKREAEEKRRADNDAAAELRKRRVDEIRQDLKDGKITKRQAEKQLREAGAEEEALKAKAAADAEENKAKAEDTANRVEVTPNIPAVAGVVKRKNYFAKCTDSDAFLKAFIAEYNTLGHFGKLREFIEVSDQALAKTARDVKDSEKMGKLYPATLAWDERTF